MIIMKISREVAFGVIIHAILVININKNVLLVFHLFLKYTDHDQILLFYHKRAFNLLGGVNQGHWLPLPQASG